VHSPANLGRPASADPARAVSVSNRVPPPGRRDVPASISALAGGCPGLFVGKASGHLRESFHTGKVCADGRFERDFLVILIGRDDGLVGMSSVERDQDGQVLHGRIRAIDSRHLACASRFASEQERSRVEAPLP
jgi:hypothetical protein